MEILDEKRRRSSPARCGASAATSISPAIRWSCNYVETPVQRRRQKKTEVTYLDATGNVKIVTRKQTVTGAWAKMDVKANKVDSRRRREGGAGRHRHHRRASCSSTSTRTRAK